MWSSFQNVLLQLAETKSLQKLFHYTVKDYIFNALHTYNQRVFNNNKTILRDEK